MTKEQGIKSKWVMSLIIANAGIFSVVIGIAVEGWPPLIAVPILLFVAIAVSIIWYLGRPEEKK